jgi:hypothetical protein
MNDGHRVVTANLGCGGPRGGAHEPPAMDWLRSCADVDLLLVQEAPVAWREAIEDRYQAVAYEGANQYRCRSFVAVREGSGLGLEQLNFDGAEYHGSYVAAATLTSRAIGELTVMSVHASPTRPSDKDVQRWTLPLPPVRPTGQPSELWDSDFVLETVARLAPRTTPMLVAGDWNEARAWDKHHPGTWWGKEFFDAVTKAGLVDCTYSRWHTEKPTHGTVYQDDHVFASASVDRIIGPVMSVEPVPGSDHDAIAFTLQS